MSNKRKRRKKPSSNQGEASKENSNQPPPGTGSSPQKRIQTEPTTITSQSSSASAKKKTRPKTGPAARRPSSKVPQQTVRQTSSTQPTKLSRYVSFGLLVGIICLLGILFYSVMSSFLVPLFLSALLVVVFRPCHAWILEKVGGREKVAAGLTTAAVLFIVLVPIGILFAMAAAEGREAVRQFNSTQIVEGVRQIRTNLNLDMPSQQSLRLIEADLAELQSQISHSPAEENRTQIVLYDIEDAAKQLAIELKLDQAEGDATAARVSLDEGSAWQEFESELTKATELHRSINWDPSASEADRRKQHETVHEFNGTINQAAKHFSVFKTELLGGKFRSWLTELANPSDSESEKYASSIVNLLRDQLFKLGGAGVAYLGSLMVGTAIMIIGLYFFLLDGPKLIESFKGLSPIDDEHEQELVAEFGRVSRAVVVATLLSALVQGLLAGVGFYFAGLESVFLLTVLSAVLAMVPFVGAAAVWIPCSLYLYFFQDSLGAAIGLALYGALIISMADNVIKPFVLHGQSNLHPLFALLSVIGGVGVLGPIGILIGPMVVAFLQTLLKILQREMQAIDFMSNSESGPSP